MPNAWLNNSLPKKKKINQGSSSFIRSNSCNALLINGTRRQYDIIQYKHILLIINASKEKKIPQLKKTY